MKPLISLFLLFIVFNACNCGIYLHNPRGSNNRLKNNQREVRNSNRLFDSGNNRRGGYLVGNLYYLQNSKLQLEWANDNSCGSDYSNCDIIIQYMCEDSVRDGVLESRIPERYENDRRFGMHESYEYYSNCKSRMRNKNLPLMSNLANDRAINTQQNPNGLRYGYECPEEHDYYPYWAPTPWKDIAVLTTQPQNCPQYQLESENVKPRYYCKIPNEINYRSAIPIDESDCAKINMTIGSQTYTAEWIASSAHGIAAPVCQAPEFTRENHLGNTNSGQLSSFNWTIDAPPHENCVLRIRQNVTWKSQREKLTKNTPNEASNFEIFDGLSKLTLDVKVAPESIAKVFQDRSHLFAIRSRPTDIPQDAKIHNLNVRGKRGNIVQVFPSTEYDYVPNTLIVSKGDYVHFQWTGSDNNPNNNDGEGRAQTDRSNLVLQGPRTYAEGFMPPNKTADGNNMWGHWGRSYPEIGDPDNRVLGGLTKQDLRNLAYLSMNQFGGDLYLLDDAGTYFDLGPRKITDVGVAHFMCTRNNNFSNRSQKGRLISIDGFIQYITVGPTGGTVISDTKNIRLIIPHNALSEPKKIKLEESKKPKLFVTGNSTITPTEPEGDGYASDFLSLGNIKFDVPVLLEMKVYDDIPTHSTVKLYQQVDGSSSWHALKTTQLSNNRVQVSITEGGNFVARYTKINLAAVIAGIVVAVLVVALLITGVVLYQRRHPQAFIRMKTAFSSKV